MPTQAKADLSGPTRPGRACRANALTFRLACPYNPRASIEREGESLAMFEQLEEPGKVPQVSKAMSLGIFAAYLVGAFGGLCLFIAFGDRPFGTQIATAITYTYFAFWYVFFPTRGLLERYSLKNKRVQQRIPLVLATHCVFLISIFLGQTIWFAIKPRLPSYWLAEHGKGGWTWHVLVMMGFLVFTFFAQVLTSRRILSGSLREGLNKSGSE